jgi:hypothetical protein
MSAKTRIVPKTHFSQLKYTYSDHERNSNGKFLLCGFANVAKKQLLLVHSDSVDHRVQSARLSPQSFELAPPTLPHPQY